VIKYRLDTMSGGRIEVRQFVFPGGEVGVDINNPSTMYPTKVERIWVDARLQNSNDVMGLLLTVDALRREYPEASTIGLLLPYVPYARQDRVCNTGEVLSIKVFAQLINSCNFSQVIIYDPHSPVAVAMIDRVQVRDQFEVFGKIKPSFREWTIVAPDQGALKKCEEFAKKVSAKGVMSCTKHRELQTGKITGVCVNGEIPNYGNFLILDDICDGGRTFIEVANLFPVNCTLELAVTHGIFSKGYETVGQYFDHVYTTDSFRGDLNAPEWESLTVLNI